MYVYNVLVRPFFKPMRLCENHSKHNGIHSNCLYYTISPIVINVFGEGGIRQVTL